MELPATADISSLEAYIKPIRLGTQLGLGHETYQILASRRKQSVEEELLQATPMYIDDTFVLKPTMDEVSRATAETVFSRIRSNMV